MFYDLVSDARVAAFLFFNLLPFFLKKIAKLEFFSLVHFCFFFCLVAFFRSYFFSFSLSLSFSFSICLIIFKSLSLGVARRVGNRATNNLPVLREKIFKFFLTKLLVLGPVRYDERNTKLANKFKFFLRVANRCIASNKFFFFLLFLFGQFPDLR